MNNYKGSDFLSESFKDKLGRNCNPFEYNFLGVSKNEVNNDLESMKTKQHPNRKIKK